MWSKNGAGGHLGLAAPSSPPAECMTITHHCSTFFTALYGVSGAQCGPARICEENVAPLAILPFPVFTGKHQPSGARSHTWTLGLAATLRSLFHTVWAETCIQVEYRRSFSRALAVSYSPYSHRVWEHSQGLELFDQGAALGIHTKN